MTPALEQAFHSQAIACETLDSPFMARMLPMLPGLIDPESALAKTLQNWPEDRLGPAHDSIPLRLASGLHLLHLSHLSPELSAAYPPNSGDLEDALAHTLKTHEPALLKALENPPQTNEVRRAAALIATGHWLTARFGKPLITSEVGASAGLNLNWDFMALTARGKTLGPLNAPVHLKPDWQGEDPTLCPAYVAEARGVDISPIDVSDPAQALRLQSYLWPDQAERLERTRAAIDLFLAPDTEAIVHQGDALAWLPTRLTPRAGHCHLIYSTVAWQYLSEPAQARGAKLISEAGAKATPDSPLAWFTMEADGQRPGAALTLRLWPGDIPGDLKISMGRADFHGRWIDWQAPDPTFRLP